MGFSSACSGKGEGWNLVVVFCVVYSPTAIFCHSREQFSILFRQQAIIQRELFDPLLVSLILDEAISVVDKKRGFAKRRAIDFRQ